MREEVKEQLITKVVDGTISCTVARALAEDIGMSCKEVGAAAVKLCIQIEECQLGCF